MIELATKACFYIFGYSSVLTFILFLGLFAAVYFLAKKNKNKKCWLFVFSITPALVWALRLLSNDYFLSDDFDHFMLLDKMNFWQIFVRGITANNIWAFHRLFTAFWLFKAINILFGTNYNAFVLVNLALHIANAYLLTLLIKKRVKNDYLVSSLVFIFSSYYLTWISNIHELVAGFFFLLAFLDIISKKHKIRSLIFYTLAVFSKEITFLLPLGYLFYPKVNLKSKIKENKLLYILFVIFLTVFIHDFLKFGSHETGSGYELVSGLGSIASNFAYYIQSRIPFLKGAFILLLFLIIPFWSSFFYLILILPVLLLGKATSYYSYIPFMFIFAGLAERLDLLFKNKINYFVLSLAVLAVFIFQINVPFQENCFLIQFPRVHARKAAMEKVVEMIKRGDNDFDKLNSAEVFEIVSNKYYLPFLK